MDSGVEMIDSLIERLNSLKCEAEVANYSPSYSAGIEASIAVVRQHQTTPSQEANYWKTRYLLLKGKTEPVSRYHRGFNDGLKGACARAEAHSKNNNLTGKCASKGTFRAHGAPESEDESGARGAQPTEQPVHISEDDGCLTIHLPHRNLMVNIAEDDTVSYSDKSNGYYANSGKDAIKRESGWLEYPGAQPKLYDGMNLSYPLLFNVKLPGADYVYQGYYNSENRCFYESGDNTYREFKTDVVGFMHYPLPDISRRESDE